MPDALVIAIPEAYTGLGCGAVAVRSSATAEDLPGAAFAGQQDSYLNVSATAAVLDAVVAAGPRSGPIGRSPTAAARGSATARRMAVVVQRMVAAGVRRSDVHRQSLTGARDEVVVDAGRGLGEAVVSGLVTPEHYV